MTTLQQWAESDTAPWTKANENDDALSAAGIFAKRAAASTGLTWAFFGGLYNGATIADGTVALTNAADNYVVVLRSTGVVSTSTSSANSLNPLYAKLYKLTTAGSVVTVTVDQRWDANGLHFVTAPGVGGGGDMILASVQTVTGAKTFGSAGAVGKLIVAGTTSGATIVDATAVAGAGTVTLPTTGTLSTLAGAETLTNKTLTSPTLTTPVLGTPASGNLSSCTADGTDAVGFRNVPGNSQSAAYTAVLADAGKSIDHPSTDANARTFTIPANSSVAYAVGTCLSFSNMTSQVVTIAITTDTMYLASAGTTGSRSLAQYGTATARKLTSTTWLISGVGLT